ncbi:MAG: hypothetical protein ACREBI_10440 [Nitrosotalea sp.]
MKTLYLTIIVIVLLFQFIFFFTPVQGTSGYAYFMKQNSTAKIDAKFTFQLLNNETWKLKPQIFSSLYDPSSEPTGMTISVLPNSFNANKSSISVTYTITAKPDTKGVYALFLFYCGLSPLVVGLNESQINPEIFNEFFIAGYMCPGIAPPPMNITDYSNMVSKIINVNPNTVNNPDLVNQLGQLPKSPLKQFKSGVKPSDIECRKDFLLITKHEDGSPACVTTYTAIILTERGWTTSVQIHNPPK